jgi:hypothetical protein
VIATKFGFDLSGAGRESGLDSRPETIRSGVEDSLQRIDDAEPHAEGERYPESTQRMIDR